MNRRNSAHKTQRPATHWGAERCVNSRGGTRTMLRNTLQGNALRGSCVAALPRYPLSYHLESYRLLFTE